MKRIPYHFKNEHELLKQLRSKALSRSVKNYFNPVKKKSLEHILKYQVSSNTYRAFKKSSKGLSPSTVFRKWVHRFINKKMSKINRIRSQKDFDRFIDLSAKSLCIYWNSKMRYDIGYGRSAKLINLIMKNLPIYEGNLASKKTTKRIISYLHVPLDSFTIQGLINIIEECNISSNASMGFINSRKMYQLFQKSIRNITNKAKVSPVYYETLAWDLAHKNG